MPDGPLRTCLRRGTFGGFRFRPGPVALYRRQELVAPSRQRLHEPRIRCGIPQRLPDLVDRCVQAVFEVNVGVGPDLFVKLLPGDHAPGLLKQQRQDLKRLLLQPHPPAVLAQLPRLEIHLEDAEAEDVLRMARAPHGLAHNSSCSSPTSCRPSVQY